MHCTPALSLSCHISASYFAFVASRTSPVRGRPRHCSASLAKADLGDLTALASVDPLVALVVSKLRSQAEQQAAQQRAAARGPATESGSTTEGEGGLGTPPLSLSAQPSGIPASPLGRDNSAKLSADLRPALKGWTVAFEDLAILRLIGEGSAGKVFLAK